MFFTVRCYLTVFKHIGVSVSHRSQMCHVEMSVHFLEAPIFMTEVTSPAILAVLLTIKLSAVLRLVLVVNSILFLFLNVKLIIIAQFILPVRILAKITVRTVSSLRPVDAQFSFIHGAFDKSFRRILMLMIFGGIEKLERIDLLIL